MTNVKQVACGNLFSLCLKNDGTVWATGDNYYGQLGLDDDANPIRSTNKWTKSKGTILTLGTKAIACGANYSMIIFGTSIYATGDNSFGQFGNGTSTSSRKWVSCSNTSKAKLIACGDYHSLYATADGSLYSTGYNYYGQLAINRPDLSSVNTWSSCGSIGPNSNAISCGNGDSMVICQDGTICAAGRNDWGQLSGNLTIGTDYYGWNIVGNVGTSNYAVSCGVSFSMVVCYNGYIYAAGSNGEGQFGNAYPAGNYNTWQYNGYNIKAIACSKGEFPRSYALCLTYDGIVLATGDNSWGQLGFGDYTDRSVWTTCPSN